MLFLKQIHSIKETKIKPTIVSFPPIFLNKSPALNFNGNSTQITPNIDFKRFIAPCKFSLLKKIQAILIKLKVINQDIIL